jgi:hypothetical protein
MADAGTHTNKWDDVVGTGLDTLDIVLNSGTWFVRFM